MTAQELIKRVLVKINVYSQDSTPSSEDNQSTLDSLNEMMGQWMEEGVPINDGDLELSDTFPVDGLEKKAIIFNLCVDVAPDFRKAVDPTIYAQADSMYQDLLSKYEAIETVTVDTMLVRNDDYQIDNG